MYGEGSCSSHYESCEEGGCHDGGCFDAYCLVEEGGLGGFGEAEEPDVDGEDESAECAGGEQSGGGCGSGEDSARCEQASDYQQ